MTRKPTFKRYSCHPLILLILLRFTHFVSGISALSTLWFNKVNKMYLGESKWLVMLPCVHHFFVLQHNQMLLAELCYNYLLMYLNIFLLFSLTQWEFVCNKFVLMEFDITKTIPTMLFHRCVLCTSVSQTANSTVPQCTKWHLVRFCFPVGLFFSVLYSARVLPLISPCNFLMTMRKNVDL